MRVFRHIRNVELVRTLTLTFQHSSSAEKKTLEETLRTLSFLHQLKEVNLNFAAMPKRSRFMGIAMAQAFQHMILRAERVNINLSNGGMDDECLEILVGHFISGFPKMTHLTLTLQRNAVSEDGIQARTGALQNVPQLNVQWL